MSGPKVQLPPEEEATASVDPIQSQYGVPGDPLVQEIAAGPAGTAPQEIGRQPGAKWPRSVAESYLRQQPKLPIFVPLSRDEEGKPRRFYQSVIWNGWEIPVRKGVPVQVPAPVAEILNQAMATKRTEQARYNRAADLMLITDSNPGGLLVEEMSDPFAVDMIRRGAPLRMGD